VLSFKRLYCFLFDCLVLVGVLGLVSDTFKVVPVGIVESADEVARIRIFPEFCDGLYRLKEFSHIIILYWFHERDSEEERRVLRVVPKRHQAKQEVGVFASRSPSRPNPIGLCVVRLVRVEGCVLVMEGLDAFEGSPVVDVKPYLPRSDFVSDVRVPEWTSHGPLT
jgi:tRNA-Thr(GGU) m(6)t(6)A37 methyltransferase TsaA